MLKKISQSKLNFSHNFRYLDLTEERSELFFLSTYEVLLIEGHIEVSHFGASASSKLVGSWSIVYSFSYKEANIFLKMHQKRHYVLSSNFLSLNLKMHLFFLLQATKLQSVQLKLFRFCRPLPCILHL